MYRWGSKPNCYLQDMKAYSIGEKCSLDAVLTYPAGSKGNGGRMLGLVIMMIAGGSLGNENRTQRPE